MSDDLLARATDSLRRSADAAGSFARSSEHRDELARIVSAVRAHTRHRRLLRRVLLQVALAMLGAGAWAAASGRLTTVLARLAPAAASVSIAPARAPATRHARTHEAPGPDIATPQPLAAPGAAEEAPAPAVLSVIAAPPSITSSIAPATATPTSRRTAAARTGRTPAPGAGPAAAAALYQVAHEAHFVRHDWPAAIIAWDRYLAADPGGPLIPEARYNRAMALARLGHAADALVTLQPFVDGEYGSYRQDEARRLSAYLRGQGQAAHAPAAGVPGR